MITYNVKYSLPFSSEMLFRQIDHINGLFAIKKGIGVFSIRRDEPGLQIIDTHLRFPLFLRFKTRLKYTTLPDKQAELKQLKGILKEYLCRYSLIPNDDGTTLNIEITVRFPFGPLGCILSLIIKPFIKLQLNTEVKTLEYNLINTHQ